MRRLIVIATVLIVGCCGARAVAAAEGADAQRGPPRGLMDFAQAARHWDGTGELLLMPKANTLGGKDAAFAIGATFDNSDSPAPDIDAARSAFGQCPSLIYPARLAGGRLVITGPLFNPGDRQPAFRSGPNAGSTEKTIEIDSCRYHLDLQVKLREGEEWIPIPRYVRPPPPPPIGPTRVLKSGETITIRLPPTPSELGLYTFTSALGPYVPSDVAARCPELAGSLWLDERGLYVDMPWSGTDAVVPGIRRNQEARTTTLIFQKPDCRLELSVRRELRTNGAWLASRLSPIPAGQAADDQPR